MKYSQDAQLFVRDRMTWLGYLLIGMYNFVSASLGALMPSMRKDLHINCTIGALHLSALAAGSFIAGMCGDKIMRRLGHRRTIWAGSAGVIAGILILLIAQHPVLTIFGAFLSGINGSVMGQTINTIMANRFQEERALGIFEANISASVWASLAPALVGACLAWHLGWRAALLFPVVAYVAIVICFGKRTPIPETDQTQKNTDGRMPQAYWAYWLSILFNVACEWSILFWSAEFLEHHCALPKAQSSMAVSAYLVAMLIGRIGGRRLAAKVPVKILLPNACALSLAGFLTFWLAHLPAFNILGLFAAGLGVANVYPLTLAAAIATAPDRASTATSRISLATGSAILILPLLLGYIADRTSIYIGYSMVGVLLIFGLAMVLVANFLSAGEGKSAHNLLPARQNTTIAGEAVLLEQPVLSE